MSVFALKSSICKKFSRSDETVFCFFCIFSGWKKHSVGHTSWVFRIKLFSDCYSISLDKTEAGVVNFYEFLKFSLLFCYFIFYVTFYNFKLGSS